jgi:hypothetical protein
MYNTGTTKHPVRISYAILITFFLIGLSACANATNSSRVTDDVSSPTNIPQDTLQAFRFGLPIESEANALIAAQAGLRTSFEYIEPLKVVEVKQMSYGEYRQQIGQPLNQPADLKVWLVVYFSNEWQSNFTMHTTALNDQEELVPVPPEARTPPPPFRGCVVVAINAADGTPVEVGGPLQTGIMAECDK